jgi:hypothetical protein
MADFVTFTLDDAEATPVTHTFDPASHQDGIAIWEDRVDGIPVGYPTISMSMKRPTRARNSYKVMAKIALPTLEQASSGGVFVPPPTKAYDNLAVVEFIMPARSTTQERKNLLKYLVGALALDQLKFMVEYTESVTG